MNLRSPGKKTDRQLPAQRRSDDRAVEPKYFPFPFAEALIAVNPKRDPLQAPPTDIKVGDEVAFLLKYRAVPYNSEIVDKALAIITPSKSQEKTCRAHVENAIGAIGLVSPKPSSAERRKQLDIVEKALKRTKQAIVNLTELFPKEQDHKAFCKTLDQLCKVADFKRGYTTVGKGKRPLDFIKCNAAENAYELLRVYARGAPTLTGGGAFHELASVLYEGVTQVEGADLSYYCRRVWAARRRRRPPPSGLPPRLPLVDGGGGGSLMAGAIGTDRASNRAQVNDVTLQKICALACVPEAQREQLRCSLQMAAEFIWLCVDLIIGPQLRPFFLARDKRVKAYARWRATLATEDKAVAAVLSSIAGEQAVAAAAYEQLQVHVVPRAIALKAQWDALTLQARLGASPAAEHFQNLVIAQLNELQSAWAQAARAQRRERSPAEYAEAARVRDKLARAYAKADKLNMPKRLSLDRPPGTVRYIEFRVFVWSLLTAVSEAGGRLSFDEKYSERGRLVLQLLAPSLPSGFIPRTVPSRLAEIYRSWRKERRQARNARKTSPHQPLRRQVGK